MANTIHEKAVAAIQLSRLAFSWYIAKEVIIRSVLLVGTYANLYGPYDLAIVTDEARFRDYLIIPKGEHDEYKRQENNYCNKKQIQIRVVHKLQYRTFKS